MCPCGLRKGPGTARSWPEPHPSLVRLPARGASASRNWVRQLHGLAGFASVGTQRSGLSLLSHEVKTSQMRVLGKQHV